MLVLSVQLPGLVSHPVLIYSCPEHYSIYTLLIVMDGRLMQNTLQYCRDQKNSSFSIFDVHGKSYLQRCKCLTILVYFAFSRKDAIEHCAISSLVFFLDDTR